MTVNELKSGECGSTDSEDNRGNGAKNQRAICLQCVRARASIELNIRQA